MSMIIRRMLRRILVVNDANTSQFVCCSSLNATARWWFSRTDSSLYISANSESNTNKSTLATVQIRELCQKLALYGHIKTSEQRIIIQEYGDWYTGRWWVGCCIWYSEEGPGRAAAPLSPLLAVTNVTTYPSTGSVPTSYHSMWHCNCLCTLKG